MIIVDDGSNDHTQKAIQPQLDKYPEKIKYIYQNNGGVSVARNTAMKNARGSLIAFLDADDLYYPQRLEISVSAIEKDKSIGLVHARSMRIDEENVPIGSLNRDTRYLSGSIFEHLILRKAHISSPTVLFRRECCDTLGLFDEHLTRLGAEDREMWIRIAQHYRIEFIDQILAYYRIRKSSLSHSTQKMFEGRIYIVDKYCPTNKNQTNLRNQALAQIHREYGDDLLLSGKKGEAREQYVRSLSYKKIAFWPTINLLKTYI